MVVLTVGGPPGSGTSTLCRLLQERTGLRYIYAGQIFREMAKERGMSLLEFSALCQRDPSIDLDLDRTMLIEAKKGDAILEGRMIGPFCAREKLYSFKIYLDADPAERAMRVRERDGGTIDEVTRAMREREEIEKDRYARYYNMDPTDRGWYDLLIDSTHFTPEEVLGLVLDKAQGWSC
jgi:predicted cytidylate kinase